jgi:predicted nuclease of predicted toxin-antitoxin system
LPLEQAGHDVSTVVEEGLQGADDELLARVCQNEDRCLVTADLDFAQSILYPPAAYPGIIVLRHPKPTLAGMTELTRQIAVAVADESPRGRLWIVEPGRLRVFGSQ